MPFPFLFLTISLAAGILFASLADFPPLLCLSILFFSLLVAWLAYWRRRNRLSLVFILVATFFFGLTLYAHDNAQYEANALRRFDFPAYVDFYGSLYKSPSFGPGVTFLFLKVEKIHFQNREEKIRGNLRVTVLHPDSYPSPLKLRAGDRIRVAAQVSPTRDFRNFDKPRLARLRKHQLLHNQAISKSPRLVEKWDEKRGLSLWTLISSFRLKLLHSIEERFSARGIGLTQEGAVLEAMILGERGRLDETTTRSLQQSGLFHLIAISGAHIAILSYLLFGVLQLFRVSRRTSYISLIVLLLFYALLVEGRPSVFRATFMTLAYLVGKLLWKNVNALNTISLSAFFLLLFNPFYLLDLGFELTFAATYSIILFLPRVLKQLPRLPLQVSELFALSLTAQLGVLPFLVRSFNRVTFSALLLNLAAVPLTGLIMALSFLFLAVSLFSSFLALLLGGTLLLLLRLFLTISHLLDFIPFISYRIPTPHGWTLFGYFSFLLLFLLRPRFKGQRLATWAGFVAFLIILISYPFAAQSSGVLKLTFLDVGQGESTLVQFPGRKIMLIDGGGAPDERFDIGEHVVSPFLWGKGFKKIDHLVLTHAHPDHLNGLKSVARNFRVVHFWESFSPPQNRSYDELKTSLKSPFFPRRVFDGFRWEVGDTEIEALHPEDHQPYVREATNEESLVLRIRRGEISFLLTADIGVASEAEILRRHPDLEAAVLKSPHHGSRTSSSFALLEQVRPQVVVISAGRGNVYGVPHWDVLERYEKLGLHILRTDRDGAIEISTDGHTIMVRTAAQPLNKTLHPVERLTASSESATIYFEPRE